MPPTPTPGKEGSVLVCSPGFLCPNSNGGAGAVGQSLLGSSCSSWNVGGKWGFPALLDTYPPLPP